MSNAILLSAGQAAKHAEVSKPTISRAITEGRLSANKREDGSWGIDPAELMRWKESYGHRHGNVSGSATPAEPPETLALHVAKARLEAELSGARSLLDAERQRADAAERDRDRWHAAFLSLPKGEDRSKAGLFDRLMGGKRSEG